MLKRTIGGCLMSALICGCATQATQKKSDLQEENAAKERAYSAAKSQKNWVRVNVVSDRFSPKTLDCLSNEQGQVMFEGDIELGSVPKTHQKGIAIVGQSYRWPKGRVPYVIDESFPNPAWAMNAMKEIHDKVGTISFVPRTSEKDYILFTRGENPKVGSSPVGRQRNGNTIRVGSQCGTGVTLHEICHSLGLWHEQSYGKRDEYLTIHWENIQSGMEFNFGQHVSDGIDVTPFNWNSRMLYFDTAFTKNGKPTMSSKIPGKKIAPDPHHLTPGDVLALKTIYP